MIDLTWEDIGEHLDKGDLEEWLKEERTKDKARQLSKDTDTPQTEETEAERLDRIDNEIEDAWARIKELTPQTDCGWGEPITVSHNEDKED